MNQQGIFKSDCRRDSNPCMQRTSNVPRSSHVIPFKKVLKDYGHGSRKRNKEIERLVLMQQTTLPLNKLS